MPRKLGFILIGLATVAGAALLAAVIRERAPDRRAPAAAAERAARLGGLTIDYPFDGTIFPPELPPPTFRWSDQAAAPVARLVFEFDDGGPPMTFRTYARSWTPSVTAWERIKRRSRERTAHATLFGVGRARDAAPRSGAAIAFRTSADPVGAPIFYREVRPPFAEAVRDPSHIAWRFGPISSTRRPRAVLRGLPMCANCHSFSADGKTLGMDVDYGNDKGSYALAAVAKEMVLDRDAIISWTDFRRADGERTYGLLSSVSPCGRYVVSTVKDRSVSTPRPDPTFSLSFFPIKGILAVYDRRTGRFAALPGADDERFVQSNPTWSPDGRTIVFARAPVHPLAAESGEDIVLPPEKARRFLAGEPVRYDLYRVDFNDGRGGTPTPVGGAAGNGKSNYFGKFSPDGKWIVFCQSNGYMLLAPDSELHIVPAAGGTARRMRCNTPRMNSWHSFSPNGRWLVFSSKAFSAWTQLFLTHLDAGGRSSPPVVLDRFTAGDRAANIPEFVNAAPDAIVRIREQFIDYLLDTAPEPSRRPPP